MLTPHRRDGLIEYVLLTVPYKFLQRFYEGRRGRASRVAWGERKEILVKKHIEKIDFTAINTQVLKGE